MSDTIDTRTAVERFLVAMLDRLDPKLAESMTPVCRAKTVERKEILFHEGEEGATVYFLLEGAVKLYRTNADGKESTIHLVNDGEIFAEILFELSNRYPVTAKTLERSTLLLIDANRFRGLIAEHPEFALRLITLLAQRLKGLVGVVEKIKQTSLSQRFVAYLLTLTGGKCGIEAMLPVSKRELALHLGVAPETLYRLIRKLTDSGIIAVDGKNVTVLRRLEPDDE